MNDSFDFLGLPGIRTTNVIRRPDTIIVEAESIEPRYVCCMFQRLGKWGDRPTRRVVNDTHHGGLPLAIHLRVRRAQCYECGKRGLTEVFDFIRPGRKMTKRLGNYIAKQTVLVGDTSSAAGRHIHISASTARRITNEYIDRHIDKLARPTPRVLGIDEKRIARQFRAVIGNIEERTVLNMLPDRDAALERYIVDLPDKEKIEVVCIDQFDGYRAMANRLLPGRAIVTDRFHVVRKANNSLDRIRSGVVSSLRDEDRTTAARLRMSRKLFYCRQHDLDEGARRAIVKWGLRFPILSKAYWAKERFFDMYVECDSPGRAEGYYKRWKWTLDPEIADHFHNLANIQKRWLPHVFAYFEHPYTTGYVESVNRGLKAMAAEGRRMSFETIRGKLMLAEKLEKRTFREIKSDPDVSYMGRSFPTEITNHGVDLALLDRALHSRSSIIRWTDKGGEEEHLPSGLSTIHPIWDDRL